MLVWCRQGEAGFGEAAINEVAAGTGSHLLARRRLSWAIRRDQAAQPPNIPPLSAGPAYVERLTAGLWAVAPPQGVLQPVEDELAVLLWRHR